MSKPGLSFYTNIPTPYQLSFFKELARLFRLKVIYYSATESNRQWDFELNDGYEVVVLRNNFIARLFQRRVADFHFSWQIFSVALRDKSEYVIVGGSYWIPNAVVALVANRLRSKKIAYFSEALFPVKNRFVYGMKWLCLRVLPLCCKAVLCIGEKAAKSFEGFGVHLPKFTVLYNIDPKPFQCLDKQKLLSFTERYKPNGECLILSSGALIERKGMDVLIKSFKAINANGIQLLIIGDGPQRDYLRDLAAADKRVVFAGFQSPEEIPYFFGIADIFCIASRYDGWGVVINEAIAAKVPVISSNRVGAALELIRTPENGTLCESGNVVAFQEAISNLVFNPDKRRGMQEKSKDLLPLISSAYYAERIFTIFTTELSNGAASKTKGRFTYS